MSGNGNGNGTPKKRTLIEEGTEFKGSMTSKCPLVVMGKVEGDVSGPSVEITDSGIVAGNVKVEELRSQGEIAGSVDARVVHLSGRVRDKTVIRAQSLEVQLSRTTGAMEVVFGVCELAVGDEPNKADAVAEALNRPKDGTPAAAPTPPSPAPTPPTATTGGEDWDNGEPAPAADDKSGKRKGERPHRRTQPPPPT